MKKKMAITMGDPCGIGPEVIVKALSDMTPADRQAFVIVGSQEILDRANTVFKTNLNFSDIESNTVGSVGVLNVPISGAENLKDGKETVAGGNAAYQYVRQAVSLIKEREMKAMITAPLDKAAMNAAGYNYNGHTELLADLTGVGDTFMLLASERLSVIHVSTHVSLQAAVGSIERRRVFDTIKMAHEHFKMRGLHAPRIAVAALNPHAGEGGLFGEEDQHVIRPAVEDAKRIGIDAAGPLAGDTVFLKASKGEFDVVVAQYHDQGHIPVKLISFNDAVNVTLGLPIFRTSVGHGTAYDIAWKGYASPSGIKAAIDYAHKFAP